VSCWFKQWRESVHRLLTSWVIHRKPLCWRLRQLALSDASSRGAASNVAKAEAEDTVDPRELARSYDFGASLVTVGHIRQLESLSYFVKNSVRELGEETIPEPNDDEVVVF
jgi:hypothetical protein